MYEDTCSLTSASTISSFTSTKKVSFQQWVDVQFTFASEDYDRLPVECDPLTASDVQEIRQMRLEMRRYTLYMERERDMMFKEQMNWQDPVIIGDGFQSIIE